MAADSNRLYKVDHHYLDGYYDELFPVGCTHSHAFVVTRVGSSDYFVHRVPLKLSILDKELQGGVYSSSWDHHRQPFCEYLTACAYGDMIVIFTRNGFVVYDYAWNVKMYLACVRFKSIDACALNEEYGIIIYNRRRIIVFNHETKKLLCDRVFECGGGSDVTVVALTFFAAQCYKFIVSTSDNGTQFFSISDESVVKIRSVCLLDTKRNINWTREIHPHIVVSATDFEMAIAWPRSLLPSTSSSSSSSSLSLQVRTDFTAYIVDVCFLMLKRPMLAVHDCENDVQFLNTSLDTTLLINQRQMIGAHVECGVPIARIRRAYRSMARCVDSPTTLCVLLPSADLCTIKFQ